MRWMGKYFVKSQTSWTWLNSSLFWVNYGLLLRKWRHPQLFCHILLRQGSAKARVKRTGISQGDLQLLHSWGLGAPLLRFQQELSNWHKAPPMTLKNMASDQYREPTPPALAQHFLRSPF